MFPSLNPQAIAEQFDLHGGLLSALPFVGGNINDTFRLETNKGKAYLLQRINGAVFPKPVWVMENMLRVLDHYNTSPVSLTSLTLVPTLQGHYWLETPQGEVWRCTHFIAGARCIKRAQSPQQAYEAGWAFGDFQKRLADLPNPPLKESLPYFHDMPRRLPVFHEVLGKTSIPLCQEATEAIEFALANQQAAHVLSDLIQAGEMPYCTTHNDAKLENLLFDQQVDKALCVLDLDTVMPGVALFDFGDLARSATCTVPESETRSVAFQVDESLFCALAQGFLTGNPTLNASERSHLVEAAQAFAYTLGLRFLTDYLAGDHYFKVTYPGQNLTRARGQFALFSDMRAKSAHLKEKLRQ